MASQKPIATISYNTEAFLREKLDEWLDAHIIQTYQYIVHKGEDGDKDHIHLRIEPNKRLDPMDLTEALKEYVKDNPKPLGVRPWRPSKEEDWFLYALHDETYLKIKYGGGDKGEKIPYDISDLRATFDYDLDVAVTRAKASLKHTAPAVIDQIRNGKKISDLLAEGENIYLINAVISALSSTDYKRCLEDLAHTQAILDGVMDAIDKAGFNLDVQEKGGYILIKKEDVK
ncbi:MAG: hypothetical protein II056_03235 [Paludibacteraceae bacterium]|nr:hypothetical protein [Paludibacteraceae bacterium]